jgi:hypothetical protein
LEEELDKPYNAFDAKPCHVGKIRFHNIRRGEKKKNLTYFGLSHGFNSLIRLFL